MSNDNNSLPSWFKPNKTLNKTYGSKRTTEPAKPSGPAVKKTKSEPEEEVRGIFSAENMQKKEKPTIFDKDVGYPPRGQNPGSSSIYSSPQRDNLGVPLKNRSPYNTLLSPLTGGPKPIIDNSPSKYSQHSDISDETGLTGLADRSQNTDGTSGFLAYQQEQLILRAKEQEQKNQIEEWKKILEENLKSKPKKLKKTLTKLNDDNQPFEYKKGIMVQYLPDSDTSSGNDASPEQEDDGPDDNLKDVFNDEKSESDSEPTPDAIIHFTENLTNLHKEVDNSPLEKEVLETNLNKMNKQLTDILNQEEITAQHLEALFDPTKINCEEKSDECSKLSIKTDTLMNEKTLSKLRGNNTVEDSKNRNRNINNIIEIMYETAIHKKIHTEYGVKKSNRDTIERFMGTDSQFMNVWGGANQTIEQSEWAKKKCCYLCQGQNVSNKITSPEMEHKLPSLEFYTKVHNINEYYPELLQKWRQYVDNNLQYIQPLYHYINCNPSAWVNDPKRFIEPQFNLVLKSFQEKNSSDEDISKFIALLKVYLMEFAYSHHTCNQMKENSNLNDPKTRDTYIKSVNVAKTNKSYPSQPLLKTVKLEAEYDYINMNDKSFENIGGHMSLVNDYIEEYALLLYEDDARNNGKKMPNTIKEYCLKKIMVQSLKSTVNFLIEYKNKEKRKNAQRMKNNQSEKYIDMLDVLDDLKEVFDEYVNLSYRAKTNYRKRVHQDAYSKSNKYNLFLDKVYNLDDNNIVENLILYGKTDDIKDANKKLEDMEINDMYNNLINSDMFRTLLAAYKANEFPNLSNYLDKHVSKEGGKNKTKKNKPKNETRRIKVKSNRKTRRRRSNNKSKKQK